MTQNWDLNYGNVVHEGFFDAIQELLGAATPSLRIYVQNTTTLRIFAGTGNDQVSTAIQGRYRWITSPINASLPGGLTTGVGSVYVTASDNLYDGAVGDPDINTVYTFGMEILASGTPVTALYRKVGEVDVVGSAIIAYRAIAGARPSGAFGLTATPDHTTQQALILTGLASQTGDMMQVKNSTGTVVWSMTVTGAVTASGGITSSSTDGLILSGNGGNDTLNLSNTTAGTGITIGGDVTVYRNAADELRTDDQVTIKRTATQAALTTQVGVETYPRVSLRTDGELLIGAGSTAGDVRVRRNAANSLTIDDGAGGTGSLTTVGSVTTGTTLTVGTSASVGTTLLVTGQATVGGLTMTGSTANKVPVSNGAGVMTPALLTNSNIDVAGTANIAHNKLANATAGQLLQANVSGVITATSVTGDVTITNAGVTAISAGVIVDADIAPAGTANIAHNKLASATAGYLLMGNASNVVTATAVTGDVTISNAGVTAISGGVIVNADIAPAGSANIAHDKLAATSPGRVLLGLTGTGVVTATAVAGDVTIDGAGVTTIGATKVTNGMLAGSIALTKLANIGIGNVIVGNASGVPTAQTMAGDVTINSGGVTAIGTGVIMGAQINNGAEIAHSKIASTPSGKVLMGSAGNITTATTISGDVTINGSGVTTIGTGRVTPDMLSRDSNTASLAVDMLLPSAAWSAVLSLDFGSAGYWVITANGVMSDPSAHVPGANTYYYVYTNGGDGSVQIGSADNNNRVPFGCSAILYSSDGVITLGMFAGGGGKTSVKAGTHITAHRISS